MLHSSLIELAEQAPLCSNTPMLRGVLAESQDLVRNAVDHDENLQELVAWFSALITDALHSPAVEELTGGARIVLTGSVGRGDALPNSPIKWLAVGPADANTEPLTKLITGVGLNTDVTPLGSAPRTKQEWIQAVKDADSSQLAIFADAGTWLLESVLARGEHEGLLAHAIALRPPAVQLLEGLPDRDVRFDVRRDLLYPIIAIARWAGVAAGSEALTTLDRIDAGLSAGHLSVAQADYLREAWAAGLQLQFRRWTDRIDNQRSTAEYLPPLQRSIYGASARSVSEVAHSLASEHGITLS